MYEEGKEKENDGSEGSADTSEAISEENTPYTTEDISENVTVEQTTGNEASEVSEEETSQTDNSEELRAEIERLREEIEKRDKENARMVAEIGEFAAIFPETSIESIPSEVWKSVNAGVPLAAAYALYEKKSAAYQKFMQSINQKNYEQSSGALGKESYDSYYSPSEVKKMSPAEVRAKYNIIIESMKKWN